MVLKYIKMCRLKEVNELLSMSAVSKEAMCSS